MAKDLNRYFKKIYSYHKEDTQITNKHMKRCLTILIRRGIQIKTKKRTTSCPLECCCCRVASVVSDSVRPHRQQPTRLPRPWDCPGKSTGVGCHCLLWPIRMTTIKKQKIASVGKDVVKLELLCAIDRNVKRYSHWKTEWCFPQKFKI